MKLCKSCKAKNVISGQAFRSYTCLNCGELKHHPNTHIPKICHDCAEKYSLCQRCLRCI